MVYVTVKLPKPVVRRMSEGAEREGVTFEEYVLELVTQWLGAEERAGDYIEVAEEMLFRAQELLEEGWVSEAAERVWGAANIAVKVFALWRAGKVLSDPKEVWEHSRSVADEFGEWVRDAWSAGQAMYVCSHEGWCDRGDVEHSLESVMRLVKVVREAVSLGRG